MAEKIINILFLLLLFNNNEIERFIKPEFLEFAWKFDIYRKLKEN